MQTMFWTADLAADAAAATARGEWRIASRSVLRELTKHVGDETAVSGFFEALAKEAAHVAAFVSSTFSDESEENAALLGVDEALVERWSETIDAHIIPTFSERKQLSFVHQNGWRLELDASQVIVGNPGEGTPALVHSRDGRRTGTWFCAVDAVEVDGVRIPRGIHEWLEGYGPLIGLMEASVIEAAK